MTITSEDLIDRALAEDVGHGDVTVEATVDPGARGVATITQKAITSASVLAACCDRASESPTKLATSWTSGSW